MKNQQTNNQHQDQEPSGTTQQKSAPLDALDYQQTRLSIKQNKAKQLALEVEIASLNLTEPLAARPISSSHLPPLSIDQHQYRVHLIPADMAPDDVEKAHAAKLLPVRELLAPDADWAAKSAHHITGLAVHSVERVDGTDTTLDELETNFDRVADRLTAAGKSGSDPSWTPGCGRAPVHTLRCTACVYGEQA